MSNALFTSPWSTELVPLLPDLKTRTRCLEVTATEQIKQFISLLYNFFGVTSIRTVHSSVHEIFFFARVYLLFLTVF